MSGLHLIHICPDFGNQRVYRNLVRQLESMDYVQDIFVPGKTSEVYGKNFDWPTSSTSYHFSPVVRPIHKIFFAWKMRQIFQAFVKSIEPQPASLVHAHYLFSAGRAALDLKRKFGLAYVVSVRHTDINFFFRFKPHLRGLGLKILEQAEAIIFISPAYKEKLFDRYIPLKSRAALLSKTLVIPNAVDDYWLDHLSKPRGSLHGPEEIRLLYVGEFSRNKNLELILRAGDFLRSLGKSIKLQLVGNYGDDCKKISTLAAARNDWVQIIDRVSDPKVLKGHYLNADIFVMPSFHETFGISYLEALTQGLPIIYSSGQGVDGHFQISPGRAIDPRSVASLAEAILEIEKDFTRLSQLAIESVQRFSWDKVGKDLEKIYISALT